MPTNEKVDKKSWIEISRYALIHNLSMFQKKVNGRKIFCVVKANAYGHGLGEVVKILDKKGADCFAVDSLDEALEIKKLGIIKPILILGYTPLSGLKEAVENGFSITVYSIDSLKYILESHFKNKVKIHLKVETGLNRQGVKDIKLLEIVKFIKKNKKYIELEGVSTHFADIEDTLDSSYSKFQLKNFKNTLKILRRNGLNWSFTHCACSAAAILYPETYFDAVRIGISLYGHWSSKETKLAYSIKNNDDFSLLPVLSWKSIIAQVKDIKKGESVGYGRSWYASKNSKIAVIPVGYSDGYDRGLSNIGRVIIRNCYAPVIGRIAMNMMMADVTDVGNVKAEDLVTLIGGRKDKEITAEEIAQKLGTINYEVLVRISPKIKRVIVK